MEFDPRVVIKYIVIKIACEGGIFKPVTVNSRIKNKP